MPALLLPALKFFGSKLGAWAIIALLIAALGVTVWAKNNKIIGLKGERDTARADLTVRTTERDNALTDLKNAVATNADYRQQLDGVTEDLATARARADAAGAALAEAHAKVDIQTLTIMKEAGRAATPADDALATPSQLAAARSLSRAYAAPKAADDHGSSAR